MIDLRSDTVTQPTQAMRQAMFTASVGDDVYDDDPTVKALEEKAAKLVGKEAALFVPSGTFGNQVCILTHTKRGDEIIVSQDAHILYHEVGAAALIAGVQLRTIPAFGGRYDLKVLEKTIREEDIHYPDTGLICIENAHGNGSVMPMSSMKGIYEVAKRKQVPVHLDGARLFNAATALKVSLAEMSQYCDSLTFCLSKGLCAPVGSIIAGKKDFIEKAKRNRKLMGGGLRQVGFLAAAGMVALDEMIDRLEVDHKNAQILEDGLKSIPGITVIENRRDINMVFFTIQDLKIEESDLINKMKEAGILINGTEDDEWRFVTHHGVDQKDLEFAVETLKTILSS